MRALAVNEAAKLLGVTPSALSGWIKKGLVAPVEGSPRQLDAVGLVTAAVMIGRDLASDLQNRVAAALRDNWRSGSPEDAGYLLVLPESSVVKWSLGAEALMGAAVRQLSAKGPYRQVLLVDLGSLARWADEQVAEPSATELEILPEPAQEAEPEPEPVPCEPATVLELDAQREDSTERFSVKEE